MEELGRQRERPLHCMGNQNCCKVTVSRLAMVDDDSWKGVIAPAMSPGAYLWASSSPYYAAYHPASSSRAHLEIYSRYNRLLAHISQYLQSVHCIGSVSVP